MTPKKKFLIGLTGILLIVLIAGILFVKHLVTRSFPDYEATITCPGLDQEVYIYRDEYGVPRIEAAHEYDAFFAIGVVHAQDRLWQMELSRRAGQGRLAEILGPDALDMDKLFRTYGFTSIVEKTLQELEPNLARLLESYSAGVNFIINSGKGRYPIEFDMLQFSPEPWEPLHTLLIAKLMAYELSLAWRVDVAMGQVFENIEYDLAMNALPGYPSRAPVIVPEELRNSRFAATCNEMLRIDSKYRKFAGIHGSHVGSNSWVVSGDLTSSGKPMLAIDPHLGLASPSRWYELHVNAGERLNVGGMTFAGVPVVVIGRNNALAWGLTNVMADDADFYFEDIDTTGTPRYRVDNEWHDMIIREEIIQIKENEPVTYTIYETHRGPLVQSLLGVQPGRWEDQPISMRWTVRAPTEELKAMYGINKAASYDEFRESLRYFSAPGQNFIYADTAGNIAYRPAVRLPIRPLGNPMLPFPGWDSRYDWSGYVPFEELPEIYNPPTGILATANNKIVDDSYPHYIGAMWEPPSRIQRITEMLNNSEVFLIPDFKRMQHDYVSVHAREVVPYILGAFEGEEISERDLSRSLSYFRNWDFYFGPEDVPSAIFNVFWVKLIENTFKPRMGDQLFNEYIGLPNIAIRALSDLLNSPDSEWFDNPGTSRRENRDDIIRKSLQDALQYLREELGDDIRTWRWGSMHTITFEHVFGQRSPIDRVVNIGPFPVGGAGTTVNNGEYMLFEPYENILGPSMRFIVDMAAPERAYTVIPTGQSGQPLHRHYKDQTPLWLDGRYKTTSMTAEAGVQYRVTTLKPKE